MHSHRRGRFKKLAFVAIPIRIHFRYTFGPKNENVILYLFKDPTEFIYSKLKDVTCYDKRIRPNEKIAPTNVRFYSVLQAGPGLTFFI